MFFVCFLGFVFRLEMGSKGGEKYLFGTHDFYYRLIKESFRLKKNHQDEITKTCGHKAVHQEKGTGLGVQVGW